jgi:hypothetical protein
MEIFAPFLHLKIFVIILVPSAGIVQVNGNVLQTKLLSITNS